MPSPSNAPKTSRNGDTSGPTLDNPTKEYLHSNYTKAQLQDHCRTVGLSPVWATKEQLVDTIMKQHQQADCDSASQPRESPTASLPHNTVGESPNTPPSPANLKDEVGRLQAIILSQNSKIECLNKQIQQANAATQTLRERVATLEQTLSSERQSDTNPELVQPSSHLESLQNALCERISALENKIKETQETGEHNMQLLKQQISSLENNTTGAPQQPGEPDQTPEDCPPHSDHAPQNKKCLILGDNNISKVRVSDLTKDCCIRTLPEANFDLMRCWVKEQLSWTPETCVIYCGLFDVQKKSEHAATLDNLGALLSELKNISENINVYVCQLVPSLQSDTLQSKISDYNENLNKWGVENGIPIIKPDPLFRLATGHIDEACYHAYGQHQGSILNRLGATRLLRALAEECTPLRERINLESLRNVPQTAHKHIHRPASPHRGPSGQHVDSDGWIRVGDRRGKSGHNPPPGPPFHRHPRHHLSTPGSVRSVKGHPAAPMGLQRPGPNYHSSLRDREDAAAGRRISTTPHHTSSSSPAHACYQHDSASVRLENYTYSRKRTGCFNCGEFNHHQSRCRFDHVILCTRCNSYGHKNRLCHHYST